MELKCSCCKETKSVELFPKAKSKKRGYAWECKACKNANRKKKKENTDPEEWFALNRSYYLKSKYGITLEEYNEKLKSQNHKCAICEQDEVDVFKQVLYVDHCHNTGKVRGLLCHPCNAALGLLKENEEILKKAKIYLREYNSGK